MTMVGKTITLTHSYSARMVLITGELTQNYSAIESGVNFWELRDRKGFRIAMATSIQDLGRKVARLEGITAPKIITTETD